MHTIRARILYTQIAVPGVEADDAIATLATMAEAIAALPHKQKQQEKDIDGGVVIISKDKDMAQLLSPYVTQLVPGAFQPPP